MVREKHGPQLDGLHVVGVVADEPGEGDLSDGGQLLHGEAARPPGVLVPEPSNIGCVFFQFFATNPLPTNRCKRSSKILMEGVRHSNCFHF